MNDPMIAVVALINIDFALLKIQKPIIPLTRYAMYLNQIGGFIGLKRAVVIRTPNIKPMKDTRCSFKNF